MQNNNTNNSSVGRTYTPPCTSQRQRYESMIKSDCDDFSQNNIMLVLIDTLKILHTLKSSINKLDIFVQHGYKIRSKYAVRRLLNHQMPHSNFLSHTPQLLTNLALLAFESRINQLRYWQQINTSGRHLAVIARSTEILLPLSQIICNYRGHPDQIPAINDIQQATCELIEFVYYLKNLAEQKFGIGNLKNIDYKTLKSLLIFIIGNSNMTITARNAKQVSRILKALNSKRIQIIDNTGSRSTSTSSTIDQPRDQANRYVIKIVVNIPNQTTSANSSSSTQTISDDTANSPVITLILERRAPTTSPRALRKQNSRDRRIVHARQIRYVKSIRGQHAAVLLTLLSR